MKDDSPIINIQYAADATSQQSINGDSEDDVTSYPLVDDLWGCNWSAIDSKGA